jgi:hypothetical protein
MIEFYMLNQSIWLHNSENVNNNDNTQEKQTITSHIHKNKTKKKDHYLPQFAATTNEIVKFLRRKYLQG